MKPAACIVVLWICFLIRGAFYSSVLPLWEGFDEWAHFAVAWHISETGEPVIDRNASTAKAINASFTMAPIPRGMTFVPAGAVTHDQYWRLTALDRTQREQSLLSLRMDSAVEATIEVLPAYEASQPPLFYWALAAVLRPIAGARLLSLVWVGRVVSVLIASFWIPLGFMLVRRVFRNDWLAVGLAALATSLPGLTLNAARVSNEGLGIALFTLLAYCILRINGATTHTRHTSWLLATGAVLGLGLLTKAYFLTALPAVALSIAHSSWKVRRFSPAVAVRNVALVIALATLVGGWWYARNLLETQTLSALDEPVMLVSMTLTDKLFGLADVDWIRAVATVVLSHVWYGGWSLIALPRIVSYVFLVLALTLFIGLLRAVDGLRRVSDCSALVGPLALYSFFWLGLMYQILMLFLSKGSSTAMNGSYLYAVVWPEIIICFLAATFIFPKNYQQWLLPAATTAMAAVDLLSLTLISIPYYTQSDGLNVSAIPRLLINKPEWMVPALLGVLSFTFFISTAVVIRISFYISPSRDTTMLADQSRISLV